MRPIVLFPFALAACVDVPLESADKSGGATSPYFGCDETFTEVGLDELGPAGVSANDAFVGLAGTYASTFVYRDESETPLTITVALASATLSHSEPAMASVPEGTVCAEDSLRVGFLLTLATNDGAFAESYPAEAAAVEVATSLSIHTYLPASALGGGYESAAMDELSIAGAVLDDGTTAGELVEIRRTTAPEGGSGTSTGAYAVGECGIGAWGGPLLTGC